MAKKARKKNQSVMVIKKAMHQISSKKIDEVKLDDELQNYMFPAKYKPKKIERYDEMLEDHFKVICGDKVTSSLKASRMNKKNLTDCL